MLNISFVCVSSSSERFGFYDYDRRKNKNNLTINMNSKMISGVWSFHGINEASMANIEV